MTTNKHRDRARPRARAALTAVVGVAVASSSVLAAATPASAATVTHDVTFAPDYSTMTSAAVGANGGVLKVTYKPSFDGETPDLSGCGVTEVEPIVMDYTISDQRPTNAYYLNPDLTYASRAVTWNDRGGAIFQLFVTRGVAALAANTGWAPLAVGVTDSEKLAALRSYFNPALTKQGGVLTTAPFVPSPQPGANFVPTQQFTVTAGKTPALQPGITDYPISWHTESNYFIVGGDGELNQFGVAGSFDGAVGTRSPEHGPGEASTVDFYWAESARGQQVSPGSISARLVFDKFSTTITCDAGAGPVVDRAIGTGAGAAALAAGAAATAVALVRRRRAQRQ